MPNGLPLVSLLVLIVMGSAFYLLWRWRRLTVQRQDAEQRASVAFLEMNRLTKELRDRGKTATAEVAALPPGERLQQMYPGAKPAGPDGSGSGGSSAPSSG